MERLAEPHGYVGAAPKHPGREDGGQGICTERIVELVLQGTWKHDRPRRPGVRPACCQGEQLGGAAFGRMDVCRTERAVDVCAADV